MVSLRPAPWLVAAVVLAMGAMGSVSALAQEATEVAEAPPTTMNLVEALLLGLTGGAPTTAPPPPATDPPPPPSEPEAAPAPPPASAVPQAAGTRTIPRSAQRAISSVQRTGPRNTQELMERLSPLLDLGLTPEELALVGFGQFPVAGAANYTDDWHQARFTPSFHLHKGTDVFAARGTPMISPVDGVVRFTTEAVGGKSAYVTEPDGTYYYFTHMEAFPPGVRSGVAIKRGDLVGFVGSSGNAAGGATHLHLQVHPRGGAPVNPKPYLDRWLDEAMANFASVLATYQVGSPRAITDAGLLRRLESGSLAGPDGARQGPELWAQALLRAGDRSGLADLLSRPVPAGDLVARGAELEIRAWEQADRLATAVLDPLTPAVLTRALGSAA